MRIKWTLLTLGAIGACVLFAPRAQTADLTPLVVGGMSGTLRVQQPIPCDDDVDRTVPLLDGRLELSPSEGLPLAGGARLFALTRGSIVFQGFSETRSCLTVEETRTYGSIRVSIARAVSFTATPTATPEVYTFNIPKETFIVQYATTLNGSPDTGTKQPIQNVTGTLNMAGGTIAMHVVLGTRVLFKGGCTFLGCIVNETTDGTLTADLAGVLQFPDTDHDGIPDRTDNCDYTANPTQAPVATPTLTPPPAVTLGSCLDHNFGKALAADVCDAKPVAVTNNAPAQFNLGPNSVLWTATDWLNRQATANQTVTIVDTTKPQFTSVPADLLLNDCISPDLGLPTATDDCAGTVTFSNNAPPIFYVGITPVQWTATDVSGNQAHAFQSVTVIDTTPPLVTCVATNPTGSSFRVHAEDHCLGTVTIRLGSFILNEGEVIMINETGQAGIRLRNDLATDGIRHFQLGKGEAIISATDASNNVAQVACPVK